MTASGSKFLNDRVNESFASSGARLLPLRLLLGCGMGFFRLGVENSGDPDILGFGNGSKNLN